MKQAGQLPGLFFDGFVLYKHQIEEGQGAQYAILCDNREAHRKFISRFKRGMTQ
jgi:hypothetical protein